MIEIPCITQHWFAIWHLLSPSAMNKVIERGCCPVIWVIERLIIIYVEKWADLIRLLKSEESTESKGSYLSCGEQTYGRTQTFRSDWNSTGTLVTNLKMQCQVLDSASVKHFLGKNTAVSRMQVLCNALYGPCWWLPWAFSAEAGDQLWEDGSRRRGQRGLSGIKVKLGHFVVALSLRNI